MSDILEAPMVISEANKYYMDVKEVMGILGCEKNKAYELIRALRKELIDAGRLTPAYPCGKVPRKYFMKRCMIEE